MSDPSLVHLSDSYCQCCGTLCFAEWKLETTGSLHKRVYLDHL